MGLKFRTSKSASPSDQPAEAPKQDFWESEEGSHSAVTEHKKLLSEQIVRLQQRQQELVAQTAKELESLKMQLEDNGQVEALVQRAKEPLVEELRSMKKHLANAEAEKKHLASELQRLQQAYTSQYAQMQSTVDALHTIVSNQARSFEPPAALAPAPLPVFEPEPEPQPVPIIIPVVAAPPVHEEILTKKEIPAPAQPDAFALHESKLKKERREEIEEKRERKPFSRRKFAIRMVTMALIVAGGTWGYKTIAAQQAASVAAIVSQAKGQVAGATTDSTIDSAPTPDPYKEAQADLPFAATDWDTIKDADYGVTFDYPKNTSNTIRSDTNIYVIRKDSYLLKITRFDLAANGNLDSWYEDHNSLVGEYTYAKGTFKGQTAWIGTARDPKSKTGTVYLVNVKNSNQVLAVYVPTVAASTDDGKRQEQMLTTFQFK